MKNTIGIAFKIINYYPYVFTLIKEAVPMRIISSVWKKLLVVGDTIRLLQSGDFYVQPGSTASMGKKK